MRTLYEWDPKKAIINLRKHGISFETAVHVFSDPCAIVDQDRIENGEQRWQTIGIVDGILMILVAHTVREKADFEVVRIISARRVTQNERRRYEKENGYL
jgi:hypothetical protein